MNNSVFVKQAGGNKNNNEDENRDENRSESMTSQTLTSLRTSVANMMGGGLQDTLESITELQRKNVIRGGGNNVFVRSKTGVSDGINSSSTSSLCD